MVSDKLAYEELFLKYYKHLCVTAYFLIKDEDESKDIVQNLFIECWEKGTYLKLEENAKNYLTQAVRNKCLNYIRNREVQDKRVAAYLCELDEPSTTDEEKVIQPMHLITQRFAQLPEQRRQALKLVYVENRRYQEAANQMGISLNSLKTHLKIGLKNLRSDLFEKN